MLYVLAKWQNEYVIVAEKRLGELQLRTGHKFKKLLTFNGDALDELVLYHPLNDKDIPILIKNDIAGDYGTGIECIAPAHDLESLKVAYHYGLPKEGYVDENGRFTDETGPIFQGLSVFDEDTNKLVANMIDQEERLLTQYQYKNEFYQTEKTRERVILRSSKNWFLQIPEQLKQKCMEELSTTKFAPKLNFKDAEETHEDYKKLQSKNKKIKKEVEAYYLNVLEELTDFNDWCISEENAWGIPIPFFTYRDTD